MTQISALRIGGRNPALKTLKSPWTLVIAMPILVAAADPGNLLNILSSAAGSLAGTLPFIAVAVLLIAGLKATGSTTLAASVFEGRESRMIILASLFGGLAPFCSCEVIPFIAALLAAGAPISAIMAFWLSSPLIDPPTVLITAAALDWNFAFGKAAAAVGIGLFGGFCTQLALRGRSFESPLRENAVSGSCCGQGSVLESNVVWKFWREPLRVQAFRMETVANSKFLLKWLSLAYMIEALLVSYVPAELIAGVVGGDGLLSIVVGALVGAPAYLNGYAAPALVAGLIEQGMSPGAGMAFMVAGAVSCIPAMVAVWSLVNARVFAAYFGFGLAGAVLSGVIFAAAVG